MRPQFISLYEAIKAGDLRPLQTLVDAAYSASPPDPDLPTSETQSLAEITGELSGFLPIISTVARFWKLPLVTFIWEPDRADDLEDFLYEKYEDDDKVDTKIKARIKALKKSAPPDKDELEHLEQEYEEGWGVCIDNPIFYLYKIDFPNADSPTAKSRPIYLLSAWAELGWNYADQTAVHGPFLFLEAVIEWFSNTYTFDTLQISDGEEKPLFIEKLRAAGVAMEAT